MRWPKYIHRKTFFIVLAADAFLLLLCGFLAVLDVRPPPIVGWLIAIPALVLNLPAMPLAIFCAIFGGDVGPQWPYVLIMATVIE